MTNTNAPGSPTVDFLHTPAGLTGHTFERRGCSIHYWSGGPQDRPAVFLLHGALMDHCMFNAQIPLLIDRYRVLVWDARGHGLSQPLAIDRPAMDDYVADARALLDHAGVDQAILIGQSMGAYIAQHLIRQSPERALALVVIGGIPVHFPLSRMDEWLLKSTVPLFQIWPLGSLKPLMARSIALKEGIRQYARTAMEPIDHKSFVAIWRAVVTAARREGYPDLHIDVPFLLTHGDADQTGSIRRDAPRWAASDPRIEYVAIPNAGHNANQDNPEFFNRVLLDFLKRRVEG